VPFYLRKAWNFGILRINLSKGGLSASVGISGCRFGWNRRSGFYIHGGGHGLYFRKGFSLKKLSKKGKK